MIETQPVYDVAKRLGRPLEHGEKYKRDRNLVLAKGMIGQITIPLGHKTEQYLPRRKPVPQATIDSIKDPELRRLTQRSNDFLYPGDIYVGGVGAGSGGKVVIVYEESSPEQEAKFREGLEDIQFNFLHLPEPSLL